MSTRVGYCGGKQPHPTYHDMGDHSETLQIDFDPTVISYRELIGLFWRSHEPCGRPWSTQYKSAVFVHDEEQLSIARETARAIAFRREKTVTTAIQRLGTFTLAEPYHQKYRLRRYVGAADEFERMYPSIEDFVRSRAVTLANALAGGALDAERYAHVELELGLSDEARRELAQAL